MPCTTAPYADCRACWTRATKSPFLPVTDIPRLLRNDLRVATVKRSIYVEGSSKAVREGRTARKKGEKTPMSDLDVRNCFTFAFFIKRPTKVNLAGDSCGLNCSACGGFRSHRRTLLTAAGEQAQTSAVVVSSAPLLL